MVAKARPSVTAKADANCRLRLSMEMDGAGTAGSFTLPHPGGELLDVADGRHLLLAVNGLQGRLDI
jgi:hypothetical protein